MAILISCGKCGKRYSVKDELAGKKIRCKECETLVAVPPPPAMTTIRLVGWS